jgi:hypothetical protein
MLNLLLFVIRKRKKALPYFLFIYALLGTCGESIAENIVFPNFDTQVSGLELDLKLFDLKVNHLGILPSGSFPYLISINSLSFTNKQIVCWVNVSLSIMKGSLEERKKRLDKLCKDLFKVYQDIFTMYDLEYKKKPDEGGQPALRMKACNLKIHIHTAGTPSHFLATWECDSMSYKEDFLAR